MSTKSNEESVAEFLRHFGCIGKPFRQETPEAEFERFVGEIIAALTAASAGTAGDVPDEEKTPPSLPLQSIAVMALLWLQSPGPLKELDAQAFIAYHARTLAAMGQPSDPIEVMLIEQFLLAHQQLVTLQRRAVEASSINEIEVYSRLVMRLLSEFRKTGLALQEYRQAKAPQQVIVQQQNYAAGNQQVAFVEHGSPPASQPILAAEPEEHPAIESEPPNPMDGTHPCHRRPPPRHHAAPILDASRRAAGTGRSGDR